MVRGVGLEIGSTTAIMGVSIGVVVVGAGSEVGLAAVTILLDSEAIMVILGIEGSQREFRGKV